MSIEVKVERREVYDNRRKEFIDDIIPTLTIKRAWKHRGTGTTAKVGSHYVAAGSSFLMTYLCISTSSPDFWWSIVARGSPHPGEIKGTVDYGYFEAAGAETRIGNIKEPVHSFGPGTFEIYFITPGSTADFGLAFEGVEI